MRFLAWCQERTSYLVSRIDKPAGMSSGGPSRALSRPFLGAPSSNAQLEGKQSGQTARPAGRRDLAAGPAGRRDLAAGAAGRRALAAG